MRTLASITLKVSRTAKIAMSISAAKSMTWSLLRRISELNQVQVGVISGHNPDIGPTGIWVVRIEAVISEWDMASIRVVRIEAVISEWDMASDSWSLRVGHSERRKVREAGLSSCCDNGTRAALPSLFPSLMGLFSLVSLS